MIEVDLPSADEAPAQTTGRIVESIDLTHDIRKITWQVDAPLRYRAGQYMNVSWPGSPGHRSYSFSAKPSADGSGRVSAFIRKVPGGAFTEPLFADSFAATEFVIEAPHGGFWLRDGDGPILLVGGGSGLSPLMSLLEDAVARGVARDAVLLFGGAVPATFTASTRSPRSARSGRGGSISGRCCRKKPWTGCAMVW
ncbi:FAD-binding oxidoreductase [Novosphingobium colocasiae]